MAVRKSTTRKKQSVTKKTRRRPTKKATPKKSAKKKAAAKKAARKKAARKKHSPGLAERTRRAIDSKLKNLEHELPKNLRSLILEIRRGVSDLENQIDQARSDGEARWKDLEDQLRRDSDRMFERFDLATPRKRGRITKEKSRPAGRKAARKSPKR